MCPKMVDGVNAVGILYLLLPTMRQGGDLDRQAFSFSQFTPLPTGAAYTLNYCRLTPPTHLPAYTSSGTLAGLIDSYPHHTHPLPTPQLFAPTARTPLPAFPTCHHTHTHCPLPIVPTPTPSLAPPPCLLPFCAHSCAPPHSGQASL